jgi:hypothetical protein
MLKAKKPNLITTMDSFSIKESKEIEIIVFFIISNKWSLGGDTSCYFCDLHVSNNYWGGGY